MRLEAVRELKSELTEPSPAASGLVSQAPPSVSQPARRAAEVAQLQPTAALGIAPTRSGDFRLAVRVQHRDLLGSARLAALEETARGEVDVRYLGRVAKLQAPPWHRTRQRPVRVGSSVGHYAITAGTVGAFVSCEDRAGRLLLSNNHVLADENRGQLGDEVLQPGRADGGRYGLDRIGALERFVVLDANRINHTDCALAALDEGIDADVTTLTGLGDLSGIVAPQEAYEVAKIGRTTGLTTGSVSAFEVDNMIVEFDTGLLRFDDQVEISGTLRGPFSLGGDSGSLVVTREDQCAVGLLFAGSDQGGPDNLGVTYANPIGAVLDRLQARLEA